MDLGGRLPGSKSCSSFYLLCDSYQVTEPLLACKMGLKMVPMSYYCLENYLG